MREASSTGGKRARPNTPSAGRRAVGRGRGTVAAESTGCLYVTTSTEEGLQVRRVRVVVDSAASSALRPPAVVTKTVAVEARALLLLKLLRYYLYRYRRSFIYFLHTIRLLLYRKIMDEQ